MRRPARILRRDRYGLLARPTYHIQIRLFWWFGPWVDASGTIPAQHGTLQDAKNNFPYFTGELKRSEVVYPTKEVA
jgi:hypothetical protein